MAGKPVDELLTGFGACDQPAQYRCVDKPDEGYQDYLSGVRFVGEVGKIARPGRSEFSGEVPARRVALRGTALMAAAHQEPIQVLVQVRPVDLCFDRRADDVNRGTGQVQPREDLRTQLLVRAAGQRDVEVVFAGEVSVDVGAGQPGVLCDLTGQRTRTVLLDSRAGGVDNLLAPSWRC